MGADGDVRIVLLVELEEGKRVHLVEDRADFLAPRDVRLAVRLGIEIAPQLRRFADQIEIAFRIRLPEDAGGLLPVFQGQLGDGRNRPALAVTAPPISFWNK